MPKLFRESPPFRVGVIQILLVDILSIVRKLYRGRGLDTDQLIQKIEKYLGKDLKFSMREFRQLELLKEDVLRLEGIMMHSSKDKLALLEHYKSHARGIRKIL